MELVGPLLNLTRRRDMLMTSVEAGAQHFLAGNYSLDVAALEKAPASP
jgi:hypothetical protein